MWGKSFYLLLALVSTVRRYKSHVKYQVIQRSVGYSVERTRHNRVRCRKDTNTSEYIDRADGSTVYLRKIVPDPSCTVGTTNLAQYRYQYGV